MADRGRPKKNKAELVTTPEQFEKDQEHYTEGACGQTEAARKAGYEFPAQAASKFLNGKDHPNIIKAIRIKQDELAEKYAITPQKTGTLLWKVAETAYKNNQFNAVVSAIKELNQLAGLSINRSQNLNINANVSGMNKDDIQERLAKLLGADIDDYSPKDK